MKSNVKKSIVIASARFDLAATVSTYLEDRGWGVEMVGSYKEAMVSVNRSNGEAFVLFDGTIGAESIESNLVDAVATCGFDGFAVMTGDSARFKWLRELGINVLPKPFLMSQLTELALGIRHFDTIRGDVNNTDNNNLYFGEVA